MEPINDSTAEWLSFRRKISDVETWVITFWLLTKLSWAGSITIHSKQNKWISYLIINLFQATHNKSESNRKAAGDSESEGSEDEAERSDDDDDNDQHSQGDSKVSV